MTPPAPHFRQVAAAPLEASDEDLIQLSDELGVPTLVKPEQKPVATPAPKIDATPQKLPEEKISPVRSSNPAVNRKDRTTAKNSAPELEPVERDSERISIEMPVYIAEQMRRRVFEERFSARYFVLKGLQALGFEVDESDLTPDARRRFARKQ